MIQTAHLIGLLGLVFFIMAEVVMCKNLSSFHVISYWSQWRVVDVVRELVNVGKLTSRYYLRV